MPNTNPFDRKLATVLKALSKGIKDAPAREKLGKDFYSIRSRVIDAKLGTILDDLFKSLSAPTDQRCKPGLVEAVEVVRTLCDRQFVSSAAFLFAAWHDIMATQPLNAILPLVPDAASFEVWRKVSAKSAKEIEQQLFAAPATTYSTAAADWLLLQAPHEKQLPLLDLFLTRQMRPKYLPTWSEALAFALQKDKRGALLPIVLCHPWQGEDRIAALAEVIRNNPALMKVTIDVLPQLLTVKEPPSSVMVLVRQLFVNVVTTTDTARQFATASLARLGTGILLHHDIGNCANKALNFIQQISHQLRGATRDTEIRSRTWVLESLQEETTPTEGQLHITLDGARRFAVAFEKATQGFPVTDILSMTARNLGLTPIGVTGETVNYDPLQHEDIDGGMIPRDSALIESQGWSHGQNVILRARVRKTKG